LSVGGGEDFRLDHFAGGIESEAEIGRAGVAVEVVALGRGGEVVAEEFIFGISDFVGFRLVGSAGGEGSGIVDFDRKKSILLPQEPGDPEDHGEAVESDEVGHGDSLDRIEAEKKPDTAVPGLLIIF